MAYPKEHVINFDGVHFSVLKKNFMVYAFGVISEKSLLNPPSQKSFLSPLFSSNSYIYLWYWGLWSILRWYLYMVWRVRVLSSFFHIWTSSCITSFAEELSFPPLNCLGTCQKSIGHKCKGLFLNFPILFCWFMSVFNRNRVVLVLILCSSFSKLFFLLF